MITVPQAVYEIIQRSPFVGEALSRGIINSTALARTIKPKVEEDTMKEVEIGSIVMAIKRLKKSVVKKSQIKKILKKSPDIIVRSKLIEATITNSSSSKSHNNFQILLDADSRNFTTVTHGVFETTVITSEENKKILNNLLKKEKIISIFDGLSSMTIRFRSDIVNIPGVYYMILKVLSWEGIGIVEVVSTNSEFTIILKEEYVERAFTLMKELFSQSSPN